MTDGAPATAVVYVIDTSSWGRIDGAADPAAAWAIVSALATAGRIKVPAEVITELQKYDELYARVRPLDALIRVSRNDVAFLRRVGEITFRHQSMSRPRSKKNRADPYVLALAELEGYTVVADETQDHRPNAKIPGVCARRRIACINLTFLLRAEGAAAGV